MPVGLEQIVAARRHSLAEARANADVRELRRRAQAHQPRRFRRALEKRASEAGFSIIAELKKASPSRGLIRADFDPEQLAAGLAQAGAAALSVLTEPEFFQGSLENLEMASRVSNLPCLRKDFIVDEFQLLEARAYGADAVLLIAAALSSAELNRLLLAAEQYDLDVLCEVHDGDELQRAADMGCQLIGVNNRDLKTFRVDVETAVRLAPQLPRGVTAVAESGIASSKDIARLRGAGYQSFLIGESLMKEKDPSAALRQLIVAAETLLSSSQLGATPR
jgi:indole-3-glycerol phosphate synthase